MTALTGWRRTLIASGIIALAAVLAYGNSFAGVFVFDDLASIPDNPSIRHLWPLREVLAPAHGGMTVSGRPLINLSLALNYAVGALRPWGYHLFNLTVHILAGLALYGVLRRTLARTNPEAKADDDFWALATALLWTLHPLQTESVTYVVQRAEAMMGLFYLSTLYAFIRSVDSEPPRRSLWAGLSVAACLLGMACKEVMVSAPVIVLLYDGTFISGSFRAAWRQRRFYYVSLAGTWLLEAWLVAQGGNRGGTSGWGSGVAAGQYWMTQFPAVIHYLKLAFWPQPLIFDYGLIWVQSVVAILPAILAVVILAGATLDLLRRRNAVGFLGFCFFALLAPTSLVAGNRQVMAEHRMYLALAPVLIVAVLALRRMGRSWPRLTLAVVFMLALPLALLTHRRNRDYRSELALYGDTVAKLPTNNFVQTAYGLALSDAGRSEEAMAHYRIAFALNPNFSDTYNDMGLTLYREGRLAEAIPYYQQGLKLNPHDASAHNDLGIALFRQGNFDQALAQYREALRIRPEHLETWDSLGNLFTREGKFPEAIAAYEHMLQIKPDYPQGLNNLGVALASAGRFDEAVARLRQALEQKPDYPEGENNLGLAYIQMGRAAEAIPYLEDAVRQRPDYARAHYNLGVALKAIGRPKESSAEFELANRAKIRAH